MKRYVTFEIEAAKSFVERTKDYFINSGFTLSGESKDELRFSRGSVVQSMVTFNPLRWKSNITIYLQGKYPWWPILILQPLGSWLLPKRSSCGTSSLKTTRRRLRGD